MGKFDDILLVSDFDRTLTNKEDEVPQANLEAIADFMREGGAFTVATGQSVEAHGKRYNRVPMNAPCIVFNGCVLYEFERKEALDITELPPDAGKLAEELAASFSKCLVTVQTLDAEYIVSPCETKEQKLLAAVFGRMARKGEYPGEKEPWLKLGVCLLSKRDMSMIEAGVGKKARGEQPQKDVGAGEQRDFFRDIDPEVDRGLTEVEQWVEKHFPGEYAVVRPLPMILEIQAAGSSKGIAARRLARRLGRNTLVCVGDALNDVSMLEEADIAYVAGDGDVALRDGRYRIAADSAQGTVASVIRELEKDGYPGAGKKNCIL